ncbi:uncharacterized protein LOC132274743 isoform X2 [Cornus florida]|nr:uncharacterized protein LOC132274743 isoform X2 [Cornus florida]
MPIEAVRFYQNSSQAFVPSGVLVNCPPRGILKRNPCGCRGLYNCLNYASFHLHADRAFEFSRNQMQYTEEVVLQLIKELSYLRNILEKSDIDGNDHIVHVNQSKEACIKAFKAEQLAKGQLSELNSDLTLVLLLLEDVTNLLSLVVLLLRTNGISQLNFLNMCKTFSPLFLLLWRRILLFGDRAPSH